MTQLVFLLSLVVIFTSVVFIPGEAVLPWFGDYKKYKCHCERNECTPTGQCAPLHSCVRGWFGPECQYADLAVKTKYSPTSAAHILTDGKKDTCTTEDTSSVTITLDKVYPFTWMRVYTKRAAACLDDSIKMLPSEPTGCIKANDPSGFFDVYCDSHGTVKSIILSGPCTNLLCSVHVSGGRNVALKERASQIESYSLDGVIYGPDRSVDGDTNGDFSVGKTCSATKERFDWRTQTANHWWKVTFQYPVKIYRYVIYNRIIDAKSRLRIKGFHLETEDKAGRIIFKHVDDKAEVQDVYELMDLNYSQPASAATLKTFSVISLNFCEMEIYGETDCAEGFYGRECKQRCSSNCDGDGCFPSTGACRSGCKPGYIGISCQRARSIADQLYDQSYRSTDQINPTGQLTKLTLTDVPT